MKQALPLILLLLSASPARAVLIDIFVHGAVDEVSDPDQLLPIGTPALGTDMEFQIGMNTDAFDLMVEDSSTGVYVSAAGTLVIGSTFIGAGDVDDRGAFVILNDVASATPGSFGDLWIATLSGPCLELAPAPCRYLGISLVLLGVGEELPLPHLESDALVVPEWPSAWTSARINYTLTEESTTGGDPVVLASVRGGVDGFATSAVPLPSAAWFVPPVLGAVLVRARRRNSGN